MPDPAVSPEAIAAGAAAGGGATLALLGRMAWDFWRGLKATARDDRRTAQADKAESDTIKRLEGHIARMEQAQAAAEERHNAEIARLYKRIAEQDDKIEELNKLLGEAMDARVQVMVEATKYREHNAALEAKVNMQQVTIESQQAKITTLTQAYKGLSEFVGRLDLSESERSSGPYRDAAVWLVQNRDRLAGAA